LANQEKTVPKHFLKVQDGIYIVKNDPRFAEKYLQYYPNDKEQLFAYGVFLEERGRHEEAVEMYKRALNHGNLKANTKIKQIKKNTKIPNAASDKTKIKLFLIVLFGAINLFIYSFGIISIVNFF
jgi:tetratricopeptide (TPR) repeat protein